MAGLLALLAPRRGAGAWGAGAGGPATICADRRPA
jgi:hypothetical protein